MSFEPGSGAPAPAAPPPTGGLHIERGICFALFAYDIGLAVDLDEAQRRITSMKQRDTIRHKRRTPTYFEFQPQPLRLTYTITPVMVGDRATAGVVEVVLYDFAAASVAFGIPIHGDLADLLALAEQLWDHPGLLAASRDVVSNILPNIAPAVTKPKISDFVEDYVIYQVEQYRSPTSLEQTVATHDSLIARLLRAETGPLSRQEISDALSCQISFGTTDRALIDWNAALLFDPEPEDVRAVLEYANVELLELRYLDDELDRALDQAYEVFSRRRNPLSVVRTRLRTDVRRIAQLQMDSALLFEGVNNALKLLGDQYLARVYRLTSQRFHLSDWDASILRKLETIESIYQKMTDRQSALRMEVLEWIIIVLIAVSIALPFIPGIPH